MDVAAIIPNAVITMAKIAMDVLIFISIKLEMPIYMSCGYAFICIPSPHFNNVYNNMIWQIIKKYLFFRVCVIKSRFGNKI
jgi:hypothetical protein